MSKSPIHTQDIISKAPGIRKLWIVFIIIGGLYVIYKFTLSHIAISLGVALLPLALIIFLIIIRFYHRIFYLLFISHFLFLLISSFTDLKIGAFTLVSNITITILIILISVYKKTSWKESKNGMLFLFIIWATFCIAELANPNTVLAAWNIAIAGYFVYPILCAVLVPITIRRYRNIEWILIIWSIFIILAAIKGYWQKNHGFNARELIFLYEKGGAETHIIWSGIRYFSFFTDAANYGVHMAMAVLGFGLSAFYAKNKWLKIYFFIVAIFAVYGMLISGTRSALAVPIGGLAFFVLLSRSKKAIFMGLLAIVATFVFFQTTTIGNSNSYIRKMRSAFTPQTDASYQVRVANRKAIKQYMVDKPFGYGLGLGGKADRFKPKELMPIPPDSWLINVWADTGIIGISLYILIHAILFAWCSWTLMFKIINKRLRNLISIWLAINAGFFLAAFGNDVMQFPNVILVYTGFAICMAAPHLEEEKALQEQIER